MTWQRFLFTGIVLAVALSMVGFVIQREAIEVGEPQGIHAVNNLTTPFELEVHLHRDHSIVISDGDQDIWYFAAFVVGALTLAATPLVHQRGPSRPPEPGPPPEDERPV